MAKIGSRQVEIGLGVETTPGTAVAATTYLKWDNFSFQAQSEKTTLTSARGIRNKTSNSMVLRSYGKGSIEFVPTVDNMPYILGLALGTRSSAAGSGESTGAYDHTFTVQNANASMKTATILVQDGSVVTERYANCVVDSLDISVDKDLASCKIGLVGNAPDTSTITSSYTQDTLFSRNQLIASFGASLTAALGTNASGTVTFSATPSNNDTITIGNFAGPATVYTMKTALTGAAYEVLIGASASTALDNLKSAINGTSGEGSTYGVGTMRNSSVVATTKTSSTLVVQANMPGTAGNALATTDTGANISWGAATLASGAASEATPLVAWTLSLNNNVLVDNAFLSGSDKPVAGGFIAGPLELKGSYTLQFSDTVEYAKYKANTLHAGVFTLRGSGIGAVSTEKIQFRLGRLVLTKAPLEYELDGIVTVKQEFEVQYDSTDKEITAVVTNTYAGTNYQ